MKPRRRHAPKKDQIVSVQPKEASAQDAAVAQLATSSTVHCLLCVFPLDDVSAVPCGHDGLICATCTVKITRHLAAPRCCPFCKTEWPDVIFDSANHLKPFAEYQSMNGLYSIDSLAARSPSKEMADKYTKLMTCHCVKCDEIGASIDFLTLEKLQDHLKRKHRLQFCMACAQHRKAFVGDLQLLTNEELQKHMKEGVPKSETHPGLEAHPVCQFCRAAFFGRDELFIHMEREHYHCHICYKQPNGTRRYEPNYKDLEVHFRRNHYLCDDATCLTARFVVFETDLGLRGHRLQVHGGNLTQRERKAMGNVQVNLVYRAPASSSQANFGQTTPQPVAALSLNDLEQFPSASSNSSATAGMGWGGSRSLSQVPLTSDNFPTLNQANDLPNGRLQNRLPLRPAKSIIEPCTNPDQVQRLNSTVVASMKSLASGPDSYKQFKRVSQDFLNGQGTKSSDLLACFMQTFAGLDGTTQDLIEALISMLPDEQKRQALHLVYRHEVDRLGINPESSAPSVSSVPRAAPVAAAPPQWVRVGPKPNSARAARAHVVNAPAATNRPAAVAAPPRPASATIIRTQTTTPCSAQWVRPSAPAYPTNPITFGSRAPPVSNPETFPSLNSLMTAVPTGSGKSEYHWKVLDEAIRPMDCRQVQTTAIVSARLDLCLSFGRHCLSVLKTKFDPEQAIPVSAQSIRRAQSQTREISVSDLDVEFPLKNLGVHVGCITRLQVIFRNNADMSYGPIYIRVDNILKEMSPSDLYILVEYVIALFRRIEAQRPNRDVKLDAERLEQNEPENANHSKKNRQSSKKRTLIQFG